MKSRKSWAVAILLALQISCAWRGREVVEIPTIVECQVPPFPEPPASPEISSTPEGVLLSVRTAAELAAWMNAVTDWRIAVESCPGHVTR